jgi:hypothetical protein
MEELLRSLVGKSIDVSHFGTGIFRGEVVEVSGGLVRLKDEQGRSIYVAIDKVTAISETDDSHSRPGFVNQP